VLDGLFRHPAINEHVGHSVVDSAIDLEHANDALPISARRAVSIPKDSAQENVDQTRQCRTTTGYATTDAGQRRGPRSRGGPGRNNMGGGLGDGRHGGVTGSNRRTTLGALSLTRRIAVSAVIRHFTHDASLSPSQVQGATSARRAK